MKSFVFSLFVLTILFFVGCVDEQKQSNKQHDYAAYFYPTDSLLPYIYAFRDDDQPLDERFYRVYTQINEKEDSTFFIIELYNSTFRMTEGYTLLLDDDYQVTDHMMVDGGGKRRKSRVSSNDFFPMNRKDTAVFISDFPAHVDSLIIVYESYKTIADDNAQVHLFDENHAAIKVKDSISVHFVNTEKQRVGSQFYNKYSYFAKGFGLVRWTDEEGEIDYQLQKILSEEWWETYAQ